MNVLFAGIVTALAAVTFAPATHAEDGKNYFLIRGVESGNQREFFDKDKFRISGGPRSVGFEVSYDTGLRAADWEPWIWWIGALRAGEGDTLTPGRYYNVGCGFMGQGHGPSMEVTENNPPCRPGGYLNGWFFIRQINHDEKGNVTGVEAVFQQDANMGGVPKIYGELRYNVHPLYIKLQPTDDFPWSNARERTVHGDLGLFNLTGNVGQRVSYVASVPEDRWTISIAPPIGKRLAAGTYPVQREANTVAAGFSMVRGSRPGAFRCAFPSGELNVLNIAHAEDGTIKGLHASYDFRCSNAPGRMRGEVRYNL